MLALLVGWGAGVTVLLVLPVSAYDPTLLAMAGSATAAMLCVVGVYVLGQAVTSFQQWRQQLSVGERLPAEGWWLASGAGGIVVFISVLVVSPDTAGWLAWREQSLGYPAVQLRMTLSADATAAQRASQQQALAQWLQPLMVQGSRTIERTMRGKHGISHHTATIPARWRWQGNTLEVVLSAQLRDSVLEPHVQHLQWLAQGGVASPVAASMGWLPLAQAECAAQHGRAMSGIGRALSSGTWQAMKRCLQARMEMWSAHVSVLKGQLQAVEVVPLQRFSPWRWGAHWNAVQITAADTP